MILSVSRTGQMSDVARMSLVSDVVELESRYKVSLLSVIESEAMECCEANDSSYCR